MKKVLILLFVVPAFLLKAHNFEGVITWKITSEITDPKMKAQMEEAQKKMKDPATVEKFILDDNQRSLSHALTLADGYPSLLLLFSTLEKKGILED